MANINKFLTHIINNFSFCKKILSSYEYFGQYGKINKLVVNKNMPYNPNNQKGPSFSAYITFSNEREASLAIYVGE